jgi:ABC-type multidrug transport system ATPase subunit
MRRRLDVAASLMPKPPVLFLDEPTTGLDLPSREELWEMIRELVEDGTTVLLTTQYLEEADRLANRIAVVDGGKVIANDSPERLKAQMGGIVIEMGMPGDGRADRAMGLLADRLPGRVEREGDTIRVTSERGARVLFDILRVLDRDDLEPDTLTVREPSIDDVFLALTGHHVAPEAMGPQVSAAADLTGVGR